MSILEIILYSLIGIGTITFVVMTIVKAIKKKKNGEQEEE